MFSSIKINLVSWVVAAYAFNPNNRETEVSEFKTSLVYRNPILGKNQTQQSLPVTDGSDTCCSGTAEANAEG